MTLLVSSFPPSLSIAFFLRLYNKYLYIETIMKLLRRTIISFMLNISKFSENKFWSIQTSSALKST